MPVLPDVGSRVVCPGPIAPRSSASSISARATRSLTEPVGLNDSIFAHRRTPGLGLRRRSSTSGVLPIAWTMSVYRPPHGRFCRGGTDTSRRIVPGLTVRSTRALKGRAGPELALDDLLERRGGLEARDPGGGDLHGLAGLRVASLAGGALEDPELAEARQRDLVARAQLVGDLLQRGLDRFLGLVVAQARLLGDCAREVGLVDGCHGYSS